MKRYILYLFLFIGLLTPYISTILLVRKSSIILLLLLDIISIFLIISSLKELLKILDNSFKKNILKYSSISIILLYFIFYSKLLDTADYFFFKEKEMQLNELVYQKRDYKEIYEMTDCLRNFKSLNEKSIDTYHLVCDSSNHSKKLFLKNEKSGEIIDKKVFEKMRKKLIEVGIIEFKTHKDGSIFFLNDGFINTFFGFVYSESGINPELCDFGFITHWKKVAKNWYVWYA
ncbi:MAG TPA: hypothetical protein PKY56_00370 [Candidatus Kapabacteria bacterium]|nr:hypothetical protein [Candidatus Kapabacteria bacterium]